MIVVLWTTHIEKPVRPSKQSFADCFWWFTIHILKGKNVMAMEFDDFIANRRVAIGKGYPVTLEEEVDLLDKMVLNGWELTAVSRQHSARTLTYYFRFHRDSGWDDES